MHFLMCLDRLSMFFYNFPFLRQSCRRRHNVTWYKLLACSFSSSSAFGHNNHRILLTNERVQSRETDRVLFPFPHHNNILRSASFLRTYTSSSPTRTTNYLHSEKFFNFINFAKIFSHHARKEIFLRRREPAGCGQSLKVDNMHVQYTHLHYLFSYILHKNVDTVCTL